MKSTVSTLFIALLLSLPVLGQKSLSVEQAVTLARTSLAPEQLSQLQWIRGSADYSFVKTGDELLRSKGLSSKAKTIQTLKVFNQWLKAAGLDTVKKYPAITWTAANEFEFRNRNGYARCNLKTGTAWQSAVLPDDASNLDKTSGNKIAFTRGDFNLYIYDGSKEIRVTDDGSRNLLYGTSVHRDEFGITKGTFWSPDGNKLAFYRMDQSMVTDYPVVDFSQKPAKENPIKYPFAGDSSHHVTVGVCDVASHKTIYLNTGMPADQYLTNIAWSPDGSSIYIAVLNRQQKHMWLNAYDAVSGTLIKTVFEETDNKYVEPLNPVKFIPGNDSLFIWQSRRDGFNHIYLYSVSGKLISQVTRGKWEVTDVAGFDKNGKNIFFTSTFNGPVNRDFCAANIDSGSVTVLTRGNGVHKCQMNETAESFIDVYSSLEIPGITRVYSITTGKAEVLLTSADPLKEYIKGNTRIFTIKGPSGDDLYCRMITPPDFDRTKKYPVFIYVYGGPHVQMITNTWLGGADLWSHVLAAKGYIIFTLDNRGSGNRGKAFEQAIFRHAGDAEMEDQLAGVEYLKSLSYVDTSRIGIDGWSYGGFMTVSLMTRHPGVFKVAVAGGPVIDWRFYEVMYTERYMDTPQENNEGYEKSNLLNYIDNLNGRMMLIHGTSDDVVMWQQSIMYVKNAVSKGKQLDYFVYPGHLHNVTGRDRVHLITKIIDYFTEHL